MCKKSRNSFNAFPEPKQPAPQPFQSPPKPNSSGNPRRPKATFIPPVELCSTCCRKTNNFYFVRYGMSRHVVCKDCYEHLVRQAQWSEQSYPQSCTQRPSIKSNMSSTRVIRRGKDIE